jgi:DHA2 family multidrug resistance protein-like MFS transporter
MLVASYAGRLADRHSAALLATAGLATFTLGLALQALLPDHAATWDICWRGLLCGIGFGFFQSPNNREMLSNASRERSGNASGVLAIMRTFGQCIGAAIVAIVLSIYASNDGAGLNALTGVMHDAQAIRLSLWVATAATALATAISISRIRNTAARPDAAQR